MSKYNLILNLLNAIFTLLKIFSIILIIYNDEKDNIFTVIFQYYMRLV